ncbi:hypothetical protein [Microbulbifer spongiae]|uniref:Uncharacterized protein n=1 Tax=Microbulbifer spongiae TaxID=2944933 RepID=A0ABY9E6B3_9GAMM|nr:hypothetical protein [Microbulbifer sp. MI-G]WKD48222.1 hypothetical protein M8T91_09745 [Microbulbifer sp. MI-G]
MRKFVTITLFAIMAVSNALATGLQQFDLAVPGTYVREEYKEDLKNWRLSLLRGVGYDAKKISEAIFLKTDIPLKVNGHESIGQVYQNKDIKHQFYILASDM